MNVLQVLMNSNTSGNSTTQCKVYGSCQSCLNDLNCQWCASSGLCIDLDKDDVSCDVSSEVDICQKVDYVLIALIVISVSASCMILFICYWKRMRRGYYHPDDDPSRIINAVFPPGHDTTHSMIWHGDKKGIDWMCVICGCDNKSDVKSCVLCGTGYTFTQEYKLMRKLRLQKERSFGTSYAIRDLEISSDTLIDEINKDENKNPDKNQDDVTSINSQSIDSSSIPSISFTGTHRIDAFTFRRLNQLSLRQKSARRRKMWQRRYDPDSGRIKWVRCTPANTVIGQGPLGFSSFFSYRFHPSKSSVDHNNSINPRLDSKHMTSSASTYYEPLIPHSEQGQDPMNDDPSLVLLAAHRSNLQDKYKPNKSKSIRDRTRSDSFHDSAYISNSPAYITIINTDNNNDNDDDDDDVQWEPITVASNPSLATVAVDMNNPVKLYDNAHINDTNPNVPRETRMISNRDIDDLEAVAALPFSEKQLWFIKQMDSLQRPWTMSGVRIDVTRTNLLISSHNAIMSLDPIDLRRPFRFTFIGEPGLDAGGLSREWFHLIVEALLDPKTGLFTSSCEDSLSGCHINPLSGMVIADHISYYRFAGRVLGKAIFDQQRVPAALSLPIRKQILGLPITFRDLEFVDSALYRSLQWLRAADADDVDAACLDFTVVYEMRLYNHNDTIASRIGQGLPEDKTPRNESNVNSLKLTRELKPRGAEESVTIANREEYLLLRLRDRMLDSVKPQLVALLRGLSDLVPRHLVQVFDYQELDLLLAGIPDVNVDDWIRHTEYQGEYKRLKDRHPVITWFWSAVKDMSQEDRARLLQFVTGCSRLPTQGFAALQSSDGRYRKFNIQSISKKDSIYPRAHTCFNKLDLPLYKSEEELVGHLSVVLHMETVTGFSME